MSRALDESCCFNDPRDQCIGAGCPCGCHIPAAAVDHLHEECDRQLVLMALAHLAVERPGFADALETIATKMQGLALYRELMEYHRKAQA